MANKRESTFKCSDIPSRGYVHFLEDLKKHRKFCDVTFRIGGESISAHRIIITAVIPYFERVLSDDDSNLKEISIPDIEPSALKCIVDFAYTCELKINAENVRELLVAASFLGVDGLREECCDFIADGFEPEEIMSIRELATDLNCSELLKSTSRYATENFAEVSQTNDFLNYSLNFLKELLSQDHLKVDGEEKVFEALMRWTNASPENRKTDLPDLLRNVRLPLLKPMYLATIVEREEFIRSSLLCRDLLDEAKNYILCPELRKQSCSFATVQREPFKNFYDEDIFEADCISNFLSGLMIFEERFDITEKKIIIEKCRPFVMKVETSVKLDNKIYCFFRGNTVEYDPIKKDYKCLASMPTLRIYAGVCLFKEKIYFAGGRVGQSRSNVVEYFDPKKDKWTRVRNMNTCRSGPSAVGLGECIIVLGGFDGTSYLDSVEKYDPVRDRWTMLPPMLTKRCLAGVTSLNGKLYVCGGQISSDQITESAEVYDPIKNSWELISPMNSARKELSVFPCGGKLYVFCSQNLERKLPYNIFDIYEPNSGEWTAGPSILLEDEMSNDFIILGCNL